MKKILLATAMRSLAFLRTSVLIFACLASAGHAPATGSNAIPAVSSAPPQLAVPVPLGIARQPKSRKVVEGEIATLSVVATGTGALAYQWMRNGQAIDGETRSSLVLRRFQLSNAGDYSVVVSNLSGSITSQIATLTLLPPTLFTRVIDGPGVADPGQGTGCVWADFNNDGFLDLYLAQYRSGTNRFYRNNGNGTFTRIVQGDVLIKAQHNLGVSAADYDNDGFLDLIVTAGGSAPVPRHSTLFHNTGDGTFAPVSAGGIPDQLGYYSSAQWADYDNDGFVDLLITHIADASESSPSTNLLWHNQGDGTFAMVTAGPLVTIKMAGWGLAWSDYDNDGFSDALVMNTTDGLNYLFHNDGGGTFSRVLDSVIATDSYSHGNPASDWGDYDNDGFQDLFVPDSGGRHNHLYHNDGAGRFANAEVGSMLIPPSGSGGRSAAWGDYDNDGYLDLLVEYFNLIVVHRNNHDGTFSEIRSIAPAVDRFTDSDSFLNTPAWVDYDNDGFLDLYLTTSNFSNPRIPNRLYHNSGNANGWLEVKCVGTVSNRSAVGAMIRLKASSDGKVFWQVRELKSGSGFNLATPLVAHFGLGDATNIETLRIEWPSGTVQELHNLASRQFLTVIEPPRLAVRPGTPGDSINLEVTCWPGFNLSVERSTDLKTWDVWKTLTTTNRKTYIDSSSPQEDAQFYRVTIP